jgi:plasmid stabilization system protein ParE
MPTWSVEFSPQAKRDLQRLYEFLLEHDRDVARRALRAIANGVEMLELFPRSCRLAAGTRKRELRELVVPFGNTGYVLLFRLRPPSRVQVVGLRHQREDDF